MKQLFGFTWTIIVNVFIDFDHHKSQGPLLPNKKLSGCFYGSLELFLEKEMATHSSILAWRIPGMEEPGGLPSMGSHRVRHNWSDLAAAAELFYSFNLHICLCDKGCIPAFHPDFIHLFQKQLSTKYMFIKPTPKILLFLDCLCEHGFVITLALPVLKLNTF